VRNKEEQKMKKVLFILLIMILASSLAFSACKGSKAGEEIVIGTVCPLTGMFTGFGEGNAFGMQAAVDDINAQGGVDVGGKKMKVRLVVLDSESSPDKVGRLAEDLITREKAIFLVMPDAPAPVTVPASTVGEKYKIPSLNCGGPFEPWNAMRTSAEPPLEYSWLTGFAIATPPDKGDFRDKPGYTVQDTWFEFLDQFGAQTNKVAGVFATDEADGRGWYALFPGLLEEWGATVVGMDKDLGLVPLETTDFSSVITEYRENNVEILWGNCPGPTFGAFWKQCNGMGFKPKIVSMGRAPLFYVDVDSWGGDLAWGVGVEVWWSPEFQDCPGIGGTTPKSLAERWTTAKKQPVNPAIGHGYVGTQIVLEAIRIAGSTDPVKINEAIPTIDMPSINQRVKFNKEQHFNRIPLFYGQWFKTDTKEKWEMKIVLSKHDFLPAEAEPIFPIP